MLILAMMNSVAVKHAIFYNVTCNMKLVHLTFMVYEKSKVCRHTPYHDDNAKCGRCILMCYGYRILDQS